MKHHYKVESSLMPEAVPQIDYSEATDALTVYLNETDFVRITALDITDAGRAALATPEPSLVCGKCGRAVEIALHTDAGWFTMTHVCPQCGVVAQYGEKKPSEAAEERAREAERKLAAEREAHRALVEAAEELTRAALAVHDNSWQPRDSDWLRVDDDSVVDLGRAAEDCRAALAALEGESHE